MHRGWTAAVIREVRPHGAKALHDFYFRHPLDCEAAVTRAQQSAASAAVPITRQARRIPWPLGLPSDPAESAWRRPAAHTRVAAGSARRDGPVPAFRCSTSSAMGSVADQRTSHPSAVFLAQDLSPRETGSSLPGPLRTKLDTVGGSCHRLGHGCVVMLGLYELVAKRRRFYCQRLDISPLGRTSC